MYNIPRLNSRFELHKLDTSTTELWLYLTKSIGMCTNNSTKHWNRLWCYVLHSVTIPCDQFLVEKLTHLCTFHKFTGKMRKWIRFSNHSLHDRLHAPYTFCRHAGTTFTKKNTHSTKHHCCKQSKKMSLWTNNERTICLTF